jgi:hypothetical protein
MSKKGINKKLKRLAIVLLILGLPILVNGCEGCSNNGDLNDDNGGSSEGLGSSADNSNGNGGNANSSNVNGGNPNHAENGGNANNNAGSDGNPNHAENSDNANNNAGSDGNPNHAENGGNANNNQPPAQITEAMIKAVIFDGLEVYVGLAPFLEKIQQGKAVNLEEKIDGLGTPLGTTCSIFVTYHRSVPDYNSTRLELFDCLLSRGASLDGIAPNGQTILEYASNSESISHLDLTRHVLKYKDKIDPATVRRAYKYAKGRDYKEIVKLFNDVGING